MTLGMVKNVAVTAKSYYVRDSHPVIILLPLVCIGMRTHPDGGSQMADATQITTAIWSRVVLMKLRRPMKNDQFRTGSTSFWFCNMSDEACINIVTELPAPTYLLFPALLPATVVLEVGLVSNGVS
jgi:hypothetical protein